MSGRPEPQQGAPSAGGPTGEPGRSSSVPVPLPGREAPAASRAAPSWRVVLAVFALSVLLTGFAHRTWLKDRELRRRPRGFFAGIAERVSRLHDYQARLRMPKEHLELLRKESQTLENNLREILLLTEKIDVLTVLLRDTRAGLHNYSWVAEGEAPGAQGHAEDLDKEMSNLVNYVLKKLREDQVQMADYALKSAGASIVEAGTSESYTSDKAKLSWHGVGLLNYQMPPDVVLQPDVHPGKCWAFPGSQGHVLIKLAGDIIPTAVTMEHISEKVSPSGSISSAPREFSVHGVSAQCDGEEVFLGQFVYNKTRPTVQTFALQHEVSEPLLCVKLKILSNWGHPKYTCLYRFRVHGSPGDPS
ncbi:Sad1 and UNC84 domain containing 3 [Phyllostomus discolor]|uniref:SUN domain-containing protein 3 n=2 Tax=Phyllostomus discolor TaxID=89673 RepID=A0A6J2M2U1_9CHIR|nr:SUN domain-containing protein 3 [Phyllostomus discolor]KAF6086953.1 Sad1 and UNC84 domain containing 3 [Phyllostomus discolor]